MKRFLLIPDPTDGGTPKLEDVLAENARLKKQLESSETLDGAVRQKMAAGLTRAQAEAAVRNQENFKARKAEVKKGSKAK